MTLVILVHGFNVWDGGRATVGKLRPFFAEAGVAYIMVNYGHFGIGETYFRNNSIAKKVADACRTARNSGHKVVAVGHSNGCAILHIAGHKYSAPIDKAVYINPALNKEAERAFSVKELDVWYSPSDSPVKWSKYLPFHPWGDMGAKGSVPGDEKTTNFNKEEGFLFSSKEHSDMFGVELLPYFGPLVVRQALN